MMSRRNERSLHVGQGATALTAGAESYRNLKARAPLRRLVRGAAYIVRAWCIPAVTALGLLGGAAAEASPDAGAFLTSRGAITAPGGAAGLCQKYAWACAHTAERSMSESALLQLATAVNDKVNRQTRSIEDRRQYGREEYWALPTRRGGDCEDFVLLKKKILLSYGVASNRLLIATVLDRKLRSHAVLVLRTAKGDLILDNQNRKILPWNRTGYTFLKKQNPKALGSWQAVLAGGVISERPTASR